MENEPYKTFKHKGYAINVMHEECIDEYDNPRESEPIGTMVCFGQNHGLGDKHNYNSEDYSGWEAMQLQIRKDHNVIEIRPLYIYDHSGITISHTPFSCRWDSCQIGWHFLAAADYKKAMLIKRISKEAKERTSEILDIELKNYDDYIRGEVYWVEITGPNMDESCHGFLGDDFEVSGLLDFARDTIDAHLKWKESQ